MIDKTEKEIAFLLKGLNTLVKCSGDYVVQYFDHWIENNDCLYIQMELCSDNLKNIIQQKKQFFRNNSSEPMKPIEYFISCQLFEEVIECVKYLHDSNIMHRDLKPENILVNINSIDHKFVKLSVFNRANFDGFIEEPKTKSHKCFKFLEMKRECSYSNCDIHCLGLIAKQLFHLDYFE